MRRTIIEILIMIVAIASLAIVFNLVSNIYTFNDERLESSINFNIAGTEGLVLTDFTRDRICRLSENNQEIVISDLNKFHRIDFFYNSSRDYVVVCCTLRNECNNKSYSP